nr:leucine-rich repeat domain-containing protein [uncultured Chryseobacterium sp.]
MRNLKRVRIKSFRSEDIEFISSLFNLEELAIEYGSGFSDLSPLQNLPTLKSLHLENLRGVSNFDGLQKIEYLKYLHIDGTLDRKQPISNFNFLHGLPNLEILSLGNIINNSAFPAFLSIIKLHQLLEIRIPIQTLDTAEYAFLEIAQPHVKKGFENKSSWPLYINKDYTDQGYVCLLGKGEGKVKLSRSDASDTLEAYAGKYEEYKKESRKIIKDYLQSQ